MSLGTKIKAYRKKAGMSQEKLAELCGVSRQAIAKWESDLSMPNSDHLFQLAQIFHVSAENLLAAEETQKEEKKKQFKKNISAGFFMILTYLLVYLLGRIICAKPQDQSVLGWLFGTDSIYYLYGWLLTSKLFWIAMLISVLPAFFGKIYYSLTTLVSFVLGIFIGEIFCPYPQGAFYGHNHYGWAIWLLIFLLSIGMGIALEKIMKKEYSQHDLKLWFGCWMLCFVIAVVFVYAVR